MSTVADLSKQLKRYPPTMRVYLAQDTEGLVCYELDTVGQHNHSIILYPNRWVSKRWMEVE